MKPGTICQIRGVPQNFVGGDLNGTIVAIEGHVGKDMYAFTPALISRIPLTPVLVISSPQCYLHPFTDFTPEQLTEIPHEENCN